MNVKRTQYRATAKRESCPICNENIRRGMPIFYVKFIGGPSRPIHVRCENAYNLEHEAFHGRAA